MRVVFATEPYAVFMTANACAKVFHLGTVDEVKAAIVSMSPPLDFEFWGGMTIEELRSVRKAFAELGIVTRYIELATTNQTLEPGDVAVLLTQEQADALAHGQQVEDILLTMHYA